MRTDYWTYCHNRLKKLADRKPTWLWTGSQETAPNGRIAEWLNLFVSGSEYFPGTEEVVRLSGDAGTEHERFDAAIHSCYSTEFARKFGIGVQGVLFTLTMDKSVSIKGMQATQN